MSLAWEKGDGPWNNDRTPYVDWWFSTEYDEDHYAMMRLPNYMTAEPAAQASEPVAAERRFVVPMPHQAANPDKVDSDWTIEGVREKLEHVEIDRDCVLLSVVDMGMPLGHRRLRLPSGRTRLVAAWQQSAEYGQDPSLPFGRELLQGEIDDLLSDHSGNDLTGPYDEDAFNRAAGLVSPGMPRGSRDLDRRASHGAHVLDLAGGYDPAANRDLAAKVRILAVNLPPRELHGSAGNFLVAFATSAVERIFLMADALWQAKQFDKTEDDGRRGFPLVINFSFGQQAGPKDGGSNWESFVQDLVRRRNSERGVPTHFVMPIGNNNLSRSNSAKALTALRRSQDANGPPDADAANVLSIPWRMSPEDRTSNYVEVWWKARQIEGQRSVKTADQGAFSLWVTPPGHTALPVPELSPGEFANLGEFARVYCYQPRRQDPAFVARAHFVICVAPTFGFDDRKPFAPAGTWTVAVQYLDDGVDDAPVHDVTFGVQTDRAGMTGSAAGRMSYFDHRNYRAVSEEGRTLDVDPDWQEAPDCPVQRSGTQNALATWEDCIAIGGYRVVDLEPSMFSSTFGSQGDGRPQAESPTALYPAEHGVAHFGLIAAGAKDGSVVSLRGTSMASALAARDISQLLANASDIQDAVGTKGRRSLKDRAVEFERKQRRPHQVPKHRGGVGRAEPPASDRVSR